MSRTTINHATMTARALMEMMDELTWHLRNETRAAEDPAARELIHARAATYEAYSAILAVRAKQDHAQADAEY